MKFILLL